MTVPTVSVIVVSRHRPEALRRCLLALFQQDHPSFEIVIVADPGAAVAARELVEEAGQVAKVLDFDEANISAARNLGLINAGGEVVAFIDDDAVAEPTWLLRLTRPFGEQAVIAATGFVRGRNGISYQWRASRVDDLAEDHQLDVTSLTVLDGSSRSAVKTQGSNCAFRRNRLLAVGGFDPAFRFYLDDADLNLRLAAFGQTAIVPGAEVHHGYHASARRDARRVPLDLHDIGASTAVFLRRHAPSEDMDAAWQRLQSRETARVHAHLRARRLSVTEAANLTASLAAGWQEGLSRDLLSLTLLNPAPDAGFRPLRRTGPRPGCVLAGRSWRFSRLRARAAVERAAGKIVTVICLSPTPRAHRVTFQPEGYWLQTGGIFGRSVRHGPRILWTTFRRRIAAETARIAAVRPVEGTSGLPEADR